MNWHVSPPLCPNRPRASSLYWRHASASVHMRDPSAFARHESVAGDAEQRALQLLLAPAERLGQNAGALEHTSEHEPPLPGVSEPASLPAVGEELHAEASAMANRQAAVKARVLKDIVDSGSGFAVPPRGASNRQAQKLFPRRTALHARTKSNILKSHDNAPGASGGRRSPRAERRAERPRHRVARCALRPRSEALRGRA